jgi:tetratricopeptide (TPR) repeat protein
MTSPRLRTSSFLLLITAKIALAQTASPMIASLPVAPPPQPPPAPVAPGPAPVATGQLDPFSDPFIQQIEARHEKAVAGDTAETKALTADLEKWTQQQPDNHLLQAYLGAVYTLESRDAWPGMGKINYLRDGWKLLDAAVAAAPDNPAVRFIRAIDYYEMPTLFGKRQIARDDFRVLVSQLNGQVKSPYVLDVKTRQAIYYYAGLSYKQLSQSADAKRVWRQGVALDPASTLAAKIGIELASLR